MVGRGVVSSKCSVRWGHKGAREYSFLEFIYVFNKYLLSSYYVGEL